MGKYADFHKRSIEQRDEFWAEEAKLIDWQTPPRQICDFSRPPFAKWFVGGMTTHRTSRSDSSRKATIQLRSYSSACNKIAR